MNDKFGFILFYYFIILIFCFFFYFIFDFTLLYFILDLDKGCDVTLYVIVTQVIKCDRIITPITVWSHMSQLQVI